MAVRHRLVERPPQEVWALLADGSRYGEWVVGTSESRPADGSWPDVDSTVEFLVRLGPWTLSGKTVVRRSEPPGLLELEADSGWLGTVRIALEVRPWGEQTLVVLDEHPLRGPGGLMHNALTDAFIQVRHRAMLGRLASVVEDAPELPDTTGLPRTAD